MSLTIKEVYVETTEPPVNLIELADRYKFSSWFARLAHKTRKDYEYCIILLLKSPYGSRKPDTITPKVAELIHKNLEENNGPAIATMFVSVWGRIYNYGIKQDWLTTNPWAMIKRSKQKARDTVWTEKMVMDFVKKAIEQGNKWLAIGVLLMYDTAQRPGDVINMTHSMVKSDEDGVYIELRQKKTDALVRIALVDYTVRLIDDSDLWVPLVGKQVKLSDFRTAFRKLANEIGIPKQVQLRDLRRTALTEIGNGGASDDEMMAQSGHKNRAMLDVYSVKNRQKALAAHRARYANRHERFS